MTSLRGRVVLLCLALAPSMAHAGAALPDLVSVIDPLFKPLVERGATVNEGDIAEGCAKMITGNTVVHFALSTFNQGNADLVLGDPGCPDCMLYPGPTCTNPLFECSPLFGHNHPHFTKYAIYEILPEPNAPAAASGHKQSFCLEDTICPDKPPLYDCFNQGLQVGCQDLYPPFALGCQYVDVTDLPGGRYLLRVKTNYDHILVESSYDNNDDQKPVDVCEGIAGPRVKIQTSKSRPDEYRWRITNRTYAQAPLVTRDPFKDGAWVRITDLGEKGPMDDRTLVDVEMPGRPGSGHCGPHDGWKRNGDSPIPVYSNASGFVDKDCTVAADGLRRFGAAMKVRELDGKQVTRVTYRMAGVSSTPLPAKRLRVEVGLGTETGPCWTASVNCETGKCLPSSADGAFVE
jgi:hypothetical protein